MHPASERRRWREKAAFFHSEDEAFLRFLIPEGQRILAVGSGTGDALAALKPALGVGIEADPALVALARDAFPDLLFVEGNFEDDNGLAGVDGIFDVVLLSDTVGSVSDCQALFERLHRFCARDTRIIIVYYSHLWDPLLKLAEMIGVRRPQPQHNVMSPPDIANLARLADFDPIKSEKRMLVPFRLFGVGRLVNRFISVLPVVREAALRHYTVCRSLRATDAAIASATVVVPARNERGNIESAIRRMPRFCDDIEVIFIEGHSQDGTFEEMQRVRDAHPEWDIKVMRQPGKGKADAVFTAFDAARGDVLMILDADLTVPPEQLTKFWDALKSGKAEFANGSRLVYPMEDEAMQFLNLIANKSFSLLFSWLLNQRFTDTLCGTKVMRRSDYRRLKAGRSYFGDFDPFGDFDLIFGATKLNLKCVDVPIRYAARTYGSTQISRFRHGVMLLKMVVFAFFKVKAL
jgi:SAM-dependent methyltransferase